MRARVDGQGYVVGFGFGVGLGLELGTAGAVNRRVWFSVDNMTGPDGVVAVGDI